VLTRSPPCPACSRQGLSRFKRIAGGGIAGRLWLGYLRGGVPGRDILRRILEGENPPEGSRVALAGALVRWRFRC